ncbi:MAG: YifB family Mg chelatase-like AAA ATPase [Gemmatimonadetes bacterium]|nr:YifB family Mg chelatase-like AAA ATPase [Gemmatimonadota bacterium]
MLARVRSAVVIGVDGQPVDVEVDLSSGLPSFTTVGLPHGAIKEGRERIAAALANSGFEFPLRRITVNLAPADVPKAGSAFDLPIAVGVLIASDQLRLPVPALGHLAGFVFGELGLEGELRPIRGAVPVVLCARRLGASWVILPVANAAEGALVPGVEVFGAATLRNVVDHLGGARPLAPGRPVEPSRPASSEYDFAEVRGHEMAKRAMEVAAAGGHNALMIGPPGGGKTMLARRLPTILPSLTGPEALEVITVHSVAGTGLVERGQVRERPFRAPHHTVSDAGLIGGGSIPRPGEVSLAHHGVLFLDELPEFRRNVLEALRQPLEDGMVTVARAAHAVTFPARFMAIAAMNPCPCGHFGDPRRSCQCSAERIRRYRARISGPLYDRFDLHLNVGNPTWQELSGLEPGESSRFVRARVEAARSRQVQRYASLDPPVYANGQLSAKQVRKFCEPDPAAAQLLASAAERLRLSARAHGRVLRLARTIADLAGEPRIGAPHVAEAIQYRILDRTPAS